MLEAQKTNGAKPQYTFNLQVNRFDKEVIEAFKDVTSARKARDRIIRQLHAGHYNNRLLPRLYGLRELPDAVGKKAAMNVIDFHFEPLVLRTYQPNQRERYFQDLAKTLKMEPLTGVEAGNPLWIDTVHHACGFTIIYDLAAILARHYGYRKLIVLHPGKKPYQQVMIVGKQLMQMFSMMLTPLPLQENWLSALTRILTPDTAIICFVDVPQDNSGTDTAIDKSFIQLDAPADMSMKIEDMTGSATAARRLGATHMALEYPSSNIARIRAFDAATPVITCPLEDWILWPQLKIQPAARNG